MWATVLSAAASRPGPQGDVRVLIVDDSAEMAGMLGMWLEDEGCSVVTAGSGREAMDAAAVYCPDVIFLDLVLPGPDGFQVCEALRRQPLTPQVVLMTGYLNTEYSRRGADLGVVALLEKPLTREAAVTALKAAVERARRDPRGGIGAQSGVPPRRP